MEATNMMANTRSNETPQFMGILPDMVKTVVIIKPKIEVSVNVAGRGSIGMPLCFLADFCPALFDLTIFIPLLTGRSLIFAIINLLISSLGRPNHRSRWYDYRCVFDS